MQVYFKAEALMTENHIIREEETIIWIFIFRIPILETRS